ncbi:uncharacterized protein [Rhodnius prolixus]|uniref:uncharacterized protein n=1 Tax=Rhodnius prolixus TaxID=13249 RepID=UPI003D18CFC3
MMNTFFFHYLKRGSAVISSKSFLVAVVIFPNGDVGKSETKRLSAAIHNYDEHGRGCCLFSTHTEIHAEEQEEIERDWSHEVLQDVLPPRREREREIGVTRSCRMCYRRAPPARSFIGIYHCNGCCNKQIWYRIKKK